jgi:subtilisin family serine protease
MDAMLWELLAAGAPDEQVEVLIKLSDLGKFPSGPIEIVAQIGDILSCRIRRADIRAIRSDVAVLSMKASKKLALDPPVNESVTKDSYDQDSKRAIRRPANLEYTGKNTAVGIADWGIDFTHANFIDQDGHTRFMALWDQSAEYDGSNDYGFGAIYTREQIDNALASEKPFKELNYYPGLQDIFHEGMHGTHVLDIAAGNGAVGLSGIAPQACLIAVHLSTGTPNDLMGLGTSARVFDAIHFLDYTAGNMPLVVNMSMGGHGDAHEGLSLIEQAIDQLTALRSGRCFVQSCGNYFGSRTHTSGFVKRDEKRKVAWLIYQNSKSDEIEIWYEPTAILKLSLLSPTGERVLQEQVIGRRSIYANDLGEIGRYYHREDEPNTHLNQIEIILDGHAPRGKWQIILEAESSQKIRYHAWIERSTGSIADQSRFSFEEANSSTTTGSICNGFHNIAVGAIGYVNEQVHIGSFSSVGPTWDGRLKPDLTAPGIQILAAKSAAPYEDRSSNGLTAKTGTSMAAPYVAGAIALLYEASKGPLSIADVKKKLFSACEPVDLIDESEKERYGVGHLNIEKLFIDRLNDNPRKLSMDSKKPIYMESVDSVNVPIESLLEIAHEQFPGLNDEDLSEYFESLPVLDDVSNCGTITRGDVLIRRQYGDTNRAWYGIVDFAYENDIFLLTPMGKKKITTGIDKWEWKRLRPNYRNDVDEEPDQEILEEDYFDEDFFGEDADTSIANLSSLRKGASKNQINTIYKRISSATCLKHPGLPNNPLIGVTDEMIKACYNAYYMHSAISTPAVLMAFWKKEGSDKQASIRSLGSSGISASSPENAIAIFRASTYYIEMGMDVLIHFTAAAGADNAAVINDTTAKDHDSAFKTKIAELVKGKYLGRDLVKDINASLKVQKIDKDLYTVTPSTHYYIYNLLVMDALLRYHEVELKKVPDYGGIADIGLVYMHWNMRQSSFLQFIKSANKHRKESKYLVAGKPISLIEWAFNQCPIAGEFDQSRSNAIKVKYFVEVFQTVFDGSSGSTPTESSSTTTGLSEEFSDDYAEDALIRRGSKSNSAKLSWVAEPATGNNPRKRVYYVASGAAGYKGIYIEISVENTNSHYNLQGVYFALTLQWARNNAGSPIADASTVIPLAQQTGDRKFIKPSGDNEIEDETTKTFKLNIRPEDLKKAYSLLDKDNFQIQFEVFCYWYDGTFSNSYYWNSLKQHFYLVQPLELVDTGEIVDSTFGPDFENITYVIVTKKNGTKTKIKYPYLYNSYEHPVVFLHGVGETDSASVGIVDIDSQTITSSLKYTQAKAQEQTFKFDISAKFIEPGLESIVGLGYENKVSESFSKEISRSLSNTKTYQQSIGITKTLTFPEKDEPRQYFAKLVFAPVIVKGFRYSSINAKGIAAKREEIKDPFLIWRPVVWAFYYKKTGLPPPPKKPKRTVPRDLSKTEDWEEGYNTPDMVIHYKPINEESLVVNMQEFSSGIANFHNYRNPAVPHNRLPKALRQPSDIKFIVLHETSGHPTGAAFNTPKCASWSTEDPKVCKRYDDATAHLAVLMEKNPVANQPNNAVIHQFNDLCEIEYHATIFNKNAVGIEFSNRDWEDGKGVRKKNIPDRLAEEKGYVHCFWGDGYNIYKLPTSAQLEQLVELISVLIRKVIDGFPMIDKVWLQVVSFNDVKDFFDFNDKDTPRTDADKQAKRFFIYTNATDYMVPSRFLMTTGILSHGSVSNLKKDRFIDENAHTDGSFQALYSWLRIAKNYSNKDAFVKAKDLLHSPPVVVKTKNKVHWIDDGVRTGKRNIYLLNID